MKYSTEYRDPEAAMRFRDAIARETRRSWRIMEICGGQTHAILRFGIDRLLPRQIDLVHGPGCPVCVTPLELIDKAIDIASRPNVIFCSFGDMLRVPGSSKDLLSVKAQGGDVRMVYSPLDALNMARSNPDRDVVFFAIGFETTAPANAMAVGQARRENLPNFSLLVSQVLVPPAIDAILSAGDNRIQGFLAAGHVCAVTGWEEYEALAEKHRVPIVVMGFEPLDILEAIHACVRMLEEGRMGVENRYLRAVRREGNLPARRQIAEVFRTVDRKWRGIGEIPQSGLALRPEYSGYDAEPRFGLLEYRVDEPKECIGGLILQGRKKPDECAAFGKTCTPEHPLGATMVSSEGACAAYYRYRK